MTYPWSNERRVLRTVAENLYSPLRLPLGGIDVFNTLMAPFVSVAPSIVIHMKTMHAYTTPQALSLLACRAYRRMNYPRSARVADAIIINSESLRSEVQRYLEVDDRKLRLIYEAVDHDLFKPGDTVAARAQVALCGVTKPFILFVVTGSQKNCDGLLRAWALVRSERAASWRSSAPDETRGTLPGSIRWRRILRSRKTWCSSAQFRSTRRCTSTRRPMFSCIRRSMRRSGCRSSKRWLAAARS